MKKILFFFLIATGYGMAQENNPDYDAALAQQLSADDYGMKTYVLCLLKTGSNTNATKEERAQLFEGHMTNINKLAAEGKLVLAGPFGKNDKNYRGVFIFNVSSIEEANALVATDPAVKARIFEADMTLWYSSAALQQVNVIHNKVAKKKI